MHDGAASTLTFNLFPGGIPVTDGGTPDGGSTIGGTLGVGISPSSARVEVTGPADFRADFVGSETLVGLVPGRYDVSASASGFVDASDSISVAGGIATSVTLNLRRKPERALVDAVYRTSGGELDELDAEDIAQNRFVFHAWLIDREGGLDPSNLGAAPPSEEETIEIAPSMTQNLVGAFVGYRDDDGEVRPVSGARVRWRLDRQFADALGSVHFGDADSPSGSLTFGVDNDQSDTRTNNRDALNRRFPVGSFFDTQNRTGVTSPDTDGFTWVTLFSPDSRARARLLAVASVAGVEVGKGVAIKEFAPAPDLQISKSVNQETVNLGVAGSGTATFTVTVTNTGDGDASRVVLEDRFDAVAIENYAIDTSVLSGVTPVDEDGNTASDGFDSEFALAAGDSRTFQFPATVNDTNSYCNLVRIVTVEDEFRTRMTDDLSERVCFTAVEPSLNIIKDFVDDDGNSLGDSLTVAAGEQAQIRVRVSNGGSAAAADVNVSDVLASVDDQAVTNDNAAYAVADLPQGATANNRDGFDIGLGTLAAGASQDLLLTVSASEDGEYCDLVSLSAGGNAIDDDDACLRVATPELMIEKANAPMEALPGRNYTSSITLTNTGNAPAREVDLTDRLGVLGDNQDFVAYVSSDVDGDSGDFNGSQLLVSSDELTVSPGETVNMSVVSRIPNGATPGMYCDLAAYTSANAGTGQAEACISVPAFAALQTELVDEEDPVRPGDILEYTTVLYNEPRSNEVVSNHVVTYSFGVAQGQQVGSAGEFGIISSSVFLDTDPERDEDTGLVISGPGNSSAEALEQGADYTLSQPEQGVQIITFATDLGLTEGTAIYVTHNIAVPDTSMARDLNTAYNWQATGSSSGTMYETGSVESTTIID